MNIEDDGQFENEDQDPNSNYENNKNLGLRIKALELTVDLLKDTPKFTNKDVLKLACYFYDFLLDDIKVSIKRLGLDK